VGARNVQFDLGAGSDSAPNAQLRADLPGAFAYSGKAVVTGPTVPKEFLRNAYAVIPYP
jgi:hypothetical protein